MANTEKEQLVDFYNSKFQVGQIWKYQTRPIDPKSTLRILKVERLHGTTIAVHVQINSLNTKSAPDKKDGSTASHLPFSEEAVEASVTELLATKQPLPKDYEEGYGMWREAFLSGKAGVFTAPVAEVVNMIDEMMSGGSQSK